MNDNVTYYILEALELASGRLAKQAILEKYSSNELLKRVFRVVFDPYSNFYIAKIPNAPVGPSRNPSDETLINLLDALDTTSKRTVTGNAAKALITKALNGLSSFERKWCERIILKKLRLGIADTIIDNVWPNLIPRFSPALAKELEWHEENGKIRLDDTLKFPLRVEPKWDGFRCIAVKKDGDVKLYARSGKQFEDCPRIAAWLKEYLQDGYVLDGELMSSNWNDTASIAMSKKNKKDDTDMRYHVFDCLMFDDWTSKQNDEPYVDRIEVMEALVGYQRDTPVISAQGIIALNEDEVLAYYEEQLKLGFEGVMLKDLNAPYSFKRDNSIMKLKPVATYDGVVVDVLSAREGTKWDGMHTILLVMLPNGATTRVGSGFSDDERIKLDKERGNLIGRVCEVCGQPPLSDDGKIRFPRFMRWREIWDAAPEVRELSERVKSNISG
jgi:ATP-dependent DNA ligase